MPEAQARGAIGASPLAPSMPPAIRAALQKASLSAEDLETPGLALFSFARDGNILGFGGLEAHGGEVLLRSIVVDPDCRGEGVGRRIVEPLLARAGQMAARRSYLLTTSARDYFERPGCVAIDRREAPASILATRQMAGLCPASAVLMTRPLG